MHLDELVVPDQSRLPAIIKYMTPSSMLSTKSTLMFTPWSIAAFLMLSPVCFDASSTTGLSFNVISTFPSSIPPFTSSSPAMPVPLSV